MAIPTYLITGSTGFVGHYLVNYLLEKYLDITIVGISRSKNLKISDKRYINFAIDLNNNEAIASLIQKYKPSYIIHLAAESSVQYSWEKPIISFNNNVNIFLNLLESVRIVNSNCRILSVGSSESYGIVAPKNIPISESQPTNPISPYAVARVAQELLSNIYVNGFGLDIVMTRSFNHIGPGQDKRFFIPSIINQIKGQKKSKSKHVLEVGNLEIIRDFVDVRDVVVAYDNLLKHGVNGEIYNICSGSGIKLNEVLKLILKIADYSIEPITNPKYLRPNDNPIIVGDNTKIKQLCNWTPTYDLEETLSNIYHFKV